jgi:maleate isomerase
MTQTEFIEHIPFETTQVIGAKARIGMVVLASDYTLEHEFRCIFTPAPGSDAAQILDGVDLFYARIDNSPDITPDTLRAMGPKITKTADLILAGDHVDVVGFACTSASVVLGSDAVADNLRAAKPAAQTTDPACAATAALRALGARRVAVLTPYITEINKQVAARLGAAGFDVPIFGSFNESQDPVVAAITEDSLLQAMRQLTAKAQVDAVFVSCTSVRLAGAAQRMEAALGLPVVSSNLALAWHCLRLAGVQDPLPGWGQLFLQPL